MANATPGAPAESGSKGDALVLTGIMLGVLLAALDQTIVGTSLPKIVADLGGFDRFAYLFATYMLTSTVVILLASKLSDRYGRRPVLLFGMAVFLVGSMLCGLATDMTQLIVYRGVQGLGGGVIFPVAMATIADLYAPGDRGKVQGMFGAVFGLASVVGPFVGGWIVDNVHVGTIAPWRWVFYVNLPVGIVGMAIVALHFPRLARRDDHAPLDLAGASTLTVGLVAGLLATVWGGSTFAWSSWQILALATLAVASLVAFVLVETRATDPILPLGLFRSGIFRVSALATLLMGVGMFGVLSFLPTFMQGVVGFSATNSGAVLMPLMIGLLGASIVAGRLMKRFGYKVFAVAGPAVAAVGFLALSFLKETTPIPLAIGIILVCGIGMGLSMQTFVVAVQNATEKRNMGVATGSLQLFRNLGSTLGVTALGLLLNARLRTAVPADVPAPLLQGALANPAIHGDVAKLPALLLSPQFVAGAPGALVEGLKTAYTSAVSSVFLAGAIIAALAFATALFLQSRPMKSKEEYHASGESPTVAMGE